MQTPFFFFIAVKIIILSIYLAVFSSIIHSRTVGGGGMLAQIRCDIRITIVGCLIMRLMMLSE
jgi:hypothetical protein